MNRLPKPDAQCGRHFSYRDLIECGETWKAAAATGLPIDNVPLRRETYAAIRKLCRAVLDPLAERFGVPELTYGFASPRLASRIPGRIAPRLDQHASCELDRRGVPVCIRLGAAVDLIVPGVGSLEVARWIVARLAFDRLYFYADDRPIHVSAGPENTRAVVRMSRGPSGRFVPQTVHPDDFCRQTRRAFVAARQSLSRRSHALSEL